MSESGKRYIGDALFDYLSRYPGFLSEARKLVSADWQTGSDSFRQNFSAAIEEILKTEPLNPHGDFKNARGDFSYDYLERRVMEGVLDPKQEPWLWAYSTLVGACVKPEIARAALNAIECSP